MMRWLMGLNSRYWRRSLRFKCLVRHRRRMLLAVHESKHTLSWLLAIRELPQPTEAHGLLLTRFGNNVLQAWRRLSKTRFASEKMKELPFIHE
ncbi:hypothetical protein BaRGS_00021735 [Batillaria attramentaria]|uniref:Uncharacterized protein n=1 Tax=Batillaria attramentaria TaxID=370345 RepID=A0ABD0KIQ2_9CAEN